MKVHKKTFILKKKIVRPFGQVGGRFENMAKIGQKWNCGQTTKYFWLKIGRVFFGNINHLHRQFYQNRMKFGQVICNLFFCFFLVHIYVYLEGG